MISSSTHSQFLRYATVGLFSNGALYVFYVALTAMGLDPKLAMTTLYALGVAQTFIFNKRWSFRHAGIHRRTFIRYVVTYGIGYLLNLLALFVLVDRFGYPHQIVQAALLVTIAMVIFALQKFWVFRIEGSVLPTESVNP